MVTFEKSPLLIIKEKKMLRINHRYFVRSILISIIVGMFFSFLAGCVSQAELQARAKESVENYLATHERPEYIAEALREHQVTKGMNGGDVRLLYGSPSRISRSSYGVQWIFTKRCPQAHSGNIYQDSFYVYFRGAKVSGWQDYGCRY